MGPKKRSKTDKPRRQFSYVIDPDLALRIAVEAAEQNLYPAAVAEMRLLHSYHVSPTLPRQPAA